MEGRKFFSDRTSSQEKTFKSSPVKEVMEVQKTTGRNRIQTPIEHTTIEVQEITDSNKKLKDNNLQEQYYDY